MVITDDALAKINEARRAKGLLPLTKERARTIVEERRVILVNANRRADDSFDYMNFLIGYMVASMAGNGDASWQAPTNAPVSEVTYSPIEGAGGSFGGGASASWSEPSTNGGGSGSAGGSLDSGSSSSDSGSSSGGGE